MDPTQTAINIINYKTFFKSRWGCVVILVLFIISYSFIIKYFKDIEFIDNIKLIHLSPIVILSIAVFIFWNILTSRWTFAAPESQVILAVNVTKGNESHYLTILSLLRTNIVKTKLSDQVTIRDLPSDFLNARNHQKLAMKYRWPLLIIADLHSWSETGQLTHEFFNPLITGAFLGVDPSNKAHDDILRSPKIREMYYRAYVERRLELFLMSMNKLFPNLKWKVLEDNSRQGYMDISFELYELSCYCIGSYISFCIDVEKGVKILTILESEYSKSGKTMEALVVSEAIANIYGFWGTIELHHEEAEKAERYLENALNRSNDMPAWWANLAVAKEWLGKENEFLSIAEKFTNQYKNYNEALSIVAFAAIKTGRNDNARAAYMDIYRSRATWKDKMNWVTAYQYLGKYFENTGELMYLFGKAIVADAMGDPIIAEKDIIEFIRIAGDQHEYEKMVEDAKLVLHHLKN